MPLRPVANYLLLMDYFFEWYRCGRYNEISTIRLRYAFFSYLIKSIPTIINVFFIVKKILNHLFNSLVSSFPTTSRSCTKFFVLSLSSFSRISIYLLHPVFANKYFFIRRFILSIQFEWILNCKHSILWRNVNNCVKWNKLF